MAPVHAWPFPSDPRASSPSFSCRLLLAVCASWWRPGPLWPPHSQPLALSTVLVSECARGEEEKEQGRGRSWLSQKWSDNSQPRN
ncbi:uncharacterized protein BDW70DRAFT_140896 [Aspergillus foveolatus]|uniref:uncharacterized protein n=1 Tax=Aspergillus foveolatus TaxID=210207 RepID=UPI003CCCA37F